MIIRIYYFTKWVMYIMVETVIITASMGMIGHLLLKFGLKFEFLYDMMNDIPISFVASLDLLLVGIVQFLLCNLVFKINNSA